MFRASNMYGSSFGTIARWWRSMRLKRVLSVGIGLSILATVACSSGDDTNTTPVSVAATAELPLAEDFNVDSFAEINPNPEIREIDTEIDLGFYERERIPRDAIESIYTPKFVSPDEVTLQPDEIVMGLIINGDARAYPTGLLRVREMVNDEVG
ncbi:DUF3179 domain-containing protein [SAR202 cluster bacterium JH639]|nr:DUF3179 domain-containing protein [SAR202 cluster bacterium JH639]